MRYEKTEVRTVIHHRRLHHIQQHTLHHKWPNQLQMICSLMHHLHKRRLWLKVDKGLAKLLARALLARHEPSMPPLPSSVSTSVKGLAVDLSIPSYMGYCIYVFWSGKWESSTAPRGILCVAQCSHSLFSLRSMILLKNYNITANLPHNL